MDLCTLLSNMWREWRRAYTKSSFWDSLPITHERLMHFEANEPTPEDNTPQTCLHLTITLRILKLMMTIRQVPTAFLIHLYPQLLGCSKGSHEDGVVLTTAPPLPLKIKGIPIRRDGVHLASPTLLSSYSSFLNVFYGVICVCASDVIVSIGKPPLTPGEFLCYLCLWPDFWSLDKCFDQPKNMCPFWFNQHTSNKQFISITQDLCSNKKLPPVQFHNSSLFETSFKPSMTAQPNASFFLGCLPWWKHVYLV